MAAQRLLGITGTIPSLPPSPQADQYGIIEMNSGHSEPQIPLDYLFRSFCPQPSVEPA